MQRRQWIVGTAALFALAGCLASDDSDDEDDDDTDPTDDGDDLDPGVEDDDDDGTPPDDGNGDDDDGDETVQGEPIGYVADSAIHQWAFTERTDDVIEDAIGGANGIAIGDLENVSGDWRGGMAEYAPPESEAHVDVGDLETVNDAVTNRALTLFATIEPEEIVSDEAMTIFGAGGGESDWFEFRMNQSDGSATGQPVLFIRDNLGNTIHIAGVDSIETGSTSRLAVRLDGSTAGDVTLFANGDPIDTETISDDELVGYLQPAQPFGIFASNPNDPTTIGTRRFFPGTIDNVVVCNAAVSDAQIAEDAEHVESL